jgi:hypothetical protein
MSGKMKRREFTTLLGAVWSVMSVVFDSFLFRPQQELSLSHQAAAQRHDRLVVGERGRATACETITTTAMSYGSNVCDVLTGPTAECGGPSEAVSRAPGRLLP